MATLIYFVKTMIKAVYTKKHKVFEFQIESVMASYTLTKIKM